MLAAGDELERVKLGGEMATGAIGADQHARAQCVLRRGKRLTLAQRAARNYRRERRSVRGRPGGATRPGDDVVPMIVEAREEGTPLGIERGGILFVTSVELGEIGGVGALQERRAEKHVVQFVSRH